MSRCSRGRAFRPGARHATTARSPVDNCPRMSRTATTRRDRGLASATWDTGDGGGCFRRCSACWWCPGAAGRWRARRRRHPGRPPSRSAATSAGTPATTARARAPALDTDVLADECLLDAAQFGALLDRPVRPRTRRCAALDGTRSTSCYAGATDGPREPLAAINVYRVRAGTPAEAVRAAGGRSLPGLGEAATLLRRRPGRPCRSRAHGSSSRCWCRAARRPTTPGARRRAPHSPGYRRDERHAVSAASRRTGPRPRRQRRRGRRWPPRSSASGPGRGTAG